MYAIYTERSPGTYVSTYVCAHVWMHACARSVHSSVRVRARVCVSAVRVRASGGSGGATRARDLQMCVTMHICRWVRLRASACTCVCVYV